MDIRKKDMINMINVIMTLVTIKPLEWRPFSDSVSNRNQYNTD